MLVDSFGKIDGDFSEMSASKPHKLVELFKL